MARNSEKRLSGLNRFLEAKETGEQLTQSCTEPFSQVSRSTLRSEEFRAPETSTGELGEFIKKFLPPFLLLCR